jgi:hypothetical protein
MSSTTTNAAAFGLKTAGNDLQWLLHTTEKAIGELVAAFEEIAGYTDTTLSLAAETVSRVESERVASVLSNVRALGAIVRQYLDHKLQATAGVLETLTAETELLRQLSMVTDGQTDIALRINMLTVHTKIEVAHLGAVGTGFEYLARELDAFSHSLNQNTSELASQTAVRRTATENTKQLLSVELPTLRAELDRLEVALNADLTQLDAGLTRLSQAPDQFKISAEGIARQIAGVVVAVQGQDITRQQIEHVHAALAVISGKLSDTDDSTTASSAEAACAHAGLEIQIWQLNSIKATIAEWTLQIRTCLESIFQISVSDLVGIGPLVLEQERSLSAQLSHISMLEQECEAYGERIRSTLDGVAQLSRLVKEHQQRSEAARSRLRLLTFNSVIEASRLGPKADTICVIADGTAEVSEEWKRIAAISENALGKILDISESINMVMVNFSQSQRLDGTQEQSREGLESLRRAAAFAVAQGNKIEIAIEAIRTRSAEVGNITDLLEACFSRIDDVINYLQKTKKQLEIDCPDVREACASAEVEMLFSKSYTTQMERDVLHAALYGTPLAVAQECSTGNDVELF